jgi:hypothetical protein
LYDLSPNILGGYECVSLGLDKAFLLTEEQKHRYVYCILTELQKPRKPILLENYFEIPGVLDNIQVEDTGGRSI